MKILRFDAGAPRIGVLKRETVIDVTEAGGRRNTVRDIRRQARQERLGGRSQGLYLRLLRRQRRLRARFPVPLADDDDGQVV